MCVKGQALDSGLVPTVASARCKNPLKYQRGLSVFKEQATEWRKWQRGLDGRRVAGVPAWPEGSQGALGPPGRRPDLWAVSTPQAPPCGRVAGAARSEGGSWTRRGRVRARPSGLFWMFSLRGSFQGLSGPEEQTPRWGAHPGRAGMPAPRGWGQEGPKVADPREHFWGPWHLAPSAHAPAALPTAGVSPVGRLARVGSGTCGQRGCKKGKAHLHGVLCAPRRRGAHCREWRRKHPPPAPLARGSAWGARSPCRIPCPRCSSRSPALCTVAGSPGLRAGAHLGSGRAARPGCVCPRWGRAQDQRHRGGRRGRGGPPEAPHSSLESLLVWM